MELAGSTVGHAPTQIIIDHALSDQIERLGAEVSNESRTIQQLQRPQSVPDVIQFARGVITIEVMLKSG